MGKLDERQLGQRLSVCSVRFCAVKGCVAAVGKEDAATVSAPNGHGCVLDHQARRPCRQRLHPYIVLPQCWVTCKEEQLSTVARDVHCQTVVYWTSPFLSARGRNLPVHDA